MAATVAHPNNHISAPGNPPDFGAGSRLPQSQSHKSHHQQQHAIQQQQQQHRIPSSSSSSSSSPPLLQSPLHLLKQHEKLSFDDFDVVRTLGTGTFARVCLVRPRPSAFGTCTTTTTPPQQQQQQQQPPPLSSTTTTTDSETTATRNATTTNPNSNHNVFALKILRKTEIIRLKQIDHVRHELAILKDVSGHPFTTTLVGSFSDHDSLYMLLDYVPGGELFSYLRKMRRFDENTARFYAAEIVLVLEFLHETQDGVAFRDLKPENLLLDDAGHVKLVDFGFAKRLGRRVSSSTSAAGGGGGHERAAETYTLCGTPEYLAPEVIHNKGHTTAVDWWALGILLYEFMTGYPPFWHQNPIEIYKQIVEKPVLFPKEPALSPEAKDIIRQLCTVDRSRRLGNISGGAARVRAHPFFQGVDWDALYHRRVPAPIIPPIRWPGDSQCFDVYPEDDGRRDPYTDDMVQMYDHCFRGF